ncbi:MAG: hypothetical protein CMJ65_04350 [Planctomycetaceae bacterium]|nr:hypothetical protein [Planctomycetaceae bacterium]
MTADGMRLLVSVRSLDEAVEAISGGCDILDVKEPGRGSLGMADLREIVAVAEFAGSVGRASSAALGELEEWPRPGLRNTAWPRLDYAKLGLSGMAVDRGWQRKWCDVREELNVTSQWIAVAYADAESCEAPSVEAVVEAAVATRCAGVLIDTWNKSRGDLLEQIDVTRLEWVRRRTRQAGLLLGLAGRVSVEGLPRVVALKPDVVAIRSAACLEGQREQAVDSGRVALFAERLRKARVSLEAMPTAG